jgi:hypothetical protein
LAPSSKRAREDPGWRQAVIAQLFPIGSRRTQRTLDGLTVTRVLFVALMQAAFAVGLILVVITRRFGHPSLSRLAIVLVLGLGGIAIGARLRDAPLDGTNASALGASYRTRFFKGFIAGELPFLVAAVFGIVDQVLWPFLIDLPLFIVTMVLIAPSRSNIEHTQEALDASGSKLSLRGVLMAPGDDGGVRAAKKKG